MTNVFDRYFKLFLQLISATPQVLTVKVCLFHGISWENSKHSLFRIISILSNVFLMHRTKLNIVFHLICRDMFKTVLCTLILIFLTISYDYLGNISIYNKHLLCELARYSLVIIRYTTWQNYLCRKSSRCRFFYIFLASDGAVFKIKFCCFFRSSLKYTFFIPLVSRPVRTFKDVVWILTKWIWR